MQATIQARLEAITDPAERHAEALRMITHLDPERLTRHLTPEPDGSGSEKAA